MRILYSCIILLLAYIHVNGQSTSETNRPAKSIIIEPTFTSTLQASLPIQKIVVVDSRLDTSKLGYLREGFYYKQLVTPSSLAQHLQDRLNKVYASQLSDTAKGVLYLFVKHLWLQQTSHFEESGNKLVHLEAQDHRAAGGPKMQTNSYPIALCSAQIECYLKSDSNFLPLFRLDTQFIKYKVFRKAADELVTLPFQTIMEKLAQTSWHKKRKVMNWEEVVAFDNRWKRFPRVEKDTLQTGIYLTFADYLNNKITPKLFEVTMGDLTDELYVIENGERKLLDKFWGFSNGKKQYIHTSFNFFELERVGYTYEYTGIKGMLDQLNPATMRPSGSSPADLITAGVIGILSHSNKVSGTERRLQLNMETGKPY